MAKVKLNNAKVVLDGVEISTSAPVEVEFVDLPRSVRDAANWSVPVVETTKIGDTYRTYAPARRGGRVDSNQVTGDVNEFWKEMNKGVMLPGLDGIWRPVAVEMSCVATEPARMNLELLLTGEGRKDAALIDANRQAALDAADPEVAAVLKKVFEVSDQARANGKEAIATVRTGKDGKPEFDVRLVDGAG